jgi:hypothetical protein
MLSPHVKVYRRERILIQVTGVTICNRLSFLSSVDALPPVNVLRAGRFLTKLTGKKSHNRIPF